MKNAFNFLNLLNYKLADDLFNVESEVGMSKISVGKDEKSHFSFAYESFGGIPTKITNKFFVRVDLVAEDPQQSEIFVSSANFNVSNYPPNSKHS